MGDSLLEYHEVLQETRGAMNPGRLKIQTNNIVFKNVKTGKTDTIQSIDLEKAEWLIRAKGYCLKVTLHSGLIHRFDGFKESDYDRLARFFSTHFESDIVKKDVTLKGWNWGVAHFAANSLDFQVDGNTAFEIPLGYVSHSAPGKNEITIGFHQNDDAPVNLMELRFHIPPDNTNVEIDTVQEFHNNIMCKADIIQATGEGIATFSEVQCLTPRGRYDFKIYPTFLQLHGKTFDYKISYKSILRLFLLPHRDGRQNFFVISLDPPIKQGQTRYHFLILLFNKDDETTIELSLSEDEIAEKYENKISKEMSGPEYEVISRIMKTFVNRKITVPGSFKGNSGTHCVSCSYKAATGFLYPLERGFMFVHKPPIHIRFDEITTINFARSTGSTTRSFDFEVSTKAGTSYNFSSIHKDEYAKLFNFSKQKNLSIKNVDGNLSGKISYEGSSDEEGHDAYLERMKAEGNERSDDEDDSSEDEDFHLSDAEKSGDSEPDLEFDSGASSTSESEADSDDSAARRRKEKKKKEKQKRRERAQRAEEESSLEEESEEEEEEPRKKKPKPTKEKSKPVKKANKKETKDPNKPKKPQTAFFLWLNDNRSKIKEDNPGISVTEVGKKAGELWRSMDSTEKQKYEKLHAEKKLEYQAALEKYEEDGGSSVVHKPSKPQKATKKKDSSPKKSAPSAGQFQSKEFVDTDSDSDD